MTNDKVVDIQEFEKDNKIDRAKAFGKKHWKKFAIGGAAFLAGVVLWKVVGKSADDELLGVYDITGPEPVKIDESELAGKFPWEENLGRNCVMKFFVEETGEFLGEEKCTESFVRDILDSAEDLNN